MFDKVLLCIFAYLELGRMYSTYEGDSDNLFIRDLELFTHYFERGRQNQLFQT